VGDAAAVRAAFEAMPVPLFALDGPGTAFVAANAGYRAFIGRDDIIGRSMHEVFAEFAGQQIFEMIERVHATGVTQVAEEWRIQIAVDDSGVPQERFITFTISPRHDNTGAVISVNGYVVDVTAVVQARRAAQAQTVETERRYAHALDVIDTLQQALLPSGLPVLPAAEIASSYLLADADTAAGGDWFDACPLPDGRAALVIGDVVGHGVTASAVMGQLRAVLADRLADGAAPAAALAALDRAAARTRGAHAATVGLAILDPTDGTVEYCTAGHPPPLVLPADGEPHYLPTTGAGPLGTGSGFPFATAHLDVGDVLLLYSDGILERPGRTPAAATVELARTAADTAAGRALRTEETSAVERVCTQTLELLTRATGHTDDVSLLAAQRREPVGELRRQLLPR
jgi:serine phosphatase RsbU (regulator of sigma subunit)